VEKPVSTLADGGIDKNLLNRINVVGGMSDDELEAFIAVLSNDCSLPEFDSLCLP
jgi:hypothetical protein